MIAALVDGGEGTIIDIPMCIGVDVGVGVCSECSRDNVVVEIIVFHFDCRVVVIDRIRHNERGL